MTDDNWAKNLADKKKREVEGQKIQQEKDLSDRKMLDSHADPMWVELRKEIQKAVAEFNQAMESEYVTFHGASEHNRIVLETEGTTFTLLFMPQTWTLMAPSGYSYKLTVIAGNGVVWKNQNGYTFPPEMIARNEVTNVLTHKNY